MYSALNIDELRTIRKDFFEICIYAANHPKILNLIKNDKEYWYASALTEGTYAEHFDVHESLFRIISLVRYFFRFLVLVIGSAYLILNRIIVLIPMSVWVLFEFYLWILSRDTELYQFSNRYLKFQKSELLGFRRRGLKEIYVAAVWNKSLSDPKTLPSLQLLRIVKLISRGKYKLIIQGTKRFTRVYLDNDQNFKKTAIEIIKWTNKKMKKR